MYIVLCRDYAGHTTHYWACRPTCRLEPPDFRDMENRNISHVLEFWGRTWNSQNFTKNTIFNGENFEVWKIQFKTTHKTNINRTAHAPKIWIKPAFSCHILTVYNCFVIYVLDLSPKITEYEI